MRLGRANYCFLQRPGEVNVVVLDQDHVEQSDAVILPAAACDCQLIHHAQAGSGLARVEDYRFGAGNSIHEGPGQCGDAGHASEEVERCPFSGQQAPGGTGYLCHDLAVDNPGALFCLRLKLHLRIERRVDCLRHVEPGDDALLLGDDLSLHRRGRGDDAVAGGVAGADILSQCALDGIQDFRVKRFQCVLHIVYIIH